MLKIHGIIFEVPQTEFWTLYNKIKKNPEMSGMKYIEKLKYIKANLDKYYTPKKPIQAGSSKNKRKSLKNIEDIKKLPRQERWYIYRELYKEFEGKDPKDILTNKIQQLLDSI